ncbi:leucine-rich repeat domain-containing protein [Desertifilum sp. FACHB-1129]|uniref:Leucine Rich Repeat (LRR)-containing protein n=1 Tax=Desertifilum tharense IPPAS B-1220 TaxID=1781255 RepID=A0A1E5QP99_9CYAN|nr:MULTISPECIES: leucine-rich repeat domain-containing protein [Desertifilum]MDA0211046.1 leucine-rich repeat domain-containing protein [Cyanobacteria bacterium FC1]MBD2312701.1 leucine-rich repeat domain-containing protein [Desertifilum sp. FACHB-1129]MBD2320182.1 leucine-rich repeat domain-containing protein [Desertifilum sp. FACHB-866]MBD2330310.1 leucine-rich repeat domain-containing protein [Desertifilum sp. FACHB-868]OEJ76495.1 hypothetical protein BH720_03885 [Desertifilum tharense IPPA
MMAVFTVRLTCALAIAIYSSGVRAIAQTPQPHLERSFTQWCRQLPNLSAEARHTVETLLIQAGTEDCEQATQELSRRNQINLSFNQISNIEPLAALSKLTRLILLKLSHNQIQDISPIAEIANLQELVLENNQIMDISPLAKLNQLTWLFLRNNQITDMSSLLELSNLIWLDLQENAIAQPRCPINRSDACLF